MPNHHPPWPPNHTDQAKLRPRQLNHLLPKQAPSPDPDRVTITSGKGRNEANTVSGPTPSKPPERVPLPGLTVPCHVTKPSCRGGPLAPPSRAPYSVCRERLTWNRLGEPDGQGGWFTGVAENNTLFGGGSELMDRGEREWHHVISRKDFQKSGRNGSMGGRQVLFSLVPWAVLEQTFFDDAMLSHSSGVKHTTHPGPTPSCLGM